MRFLRYFFYVSILAFITPSDASAHTRWFADENLAQLPPTMPNGLYAFGLACISFGVVCLAIWFERRGFLKLAWLEPKGDHMFNRAASTFSMITGAFLVIAGSHDYLFSLNLTHQAGIPIVLIYAQFLIGLGFLLGIFARVSALALAAVWVLAAFFVGLEPMLENFRVLSCAAFVFIMGTDYFSMISFRVLAHLAKKYHSYALPLLRVGSGVTLLILGFTEKLMHPEFGINFLSQYKWNFIEQHGHAVVFGLSVYAFRRSGRISPRPASHTRHRDPGERHRRRGHLRYTDIPLRADRAHGPLAASGRNRAHHPLRSREAFQIGPHAEKAVTAVYMKSSWRKRYNSSINL